MFQLQFLAVVIAFIIKHQYLEPKKVGKTLKIQLTISGSL